MKTKTTVGGVGVRGWIYQEELAVSKSPGAMLAKPLSLPTAWHDAWHRLGAQG